MIRLLVNSTIYCIQNKSDVSTLAKMLHTYDGDYKMENSANK